MIMTITTTMSFSWHTIISEQFSFECSVHLFICHSFHMNTFFCRFFPVILIDQVDKRLIFFLASLMFVIGVIVVVTATKCLCKCFFQKVYHIALVSLVFDVFQWFLLHWMCFYFFILFRLFAFIETLFSFLILTGKRLPIKKWEN